VIDIIAVAVKITTGFFLAILPSSITSIGLAFYGVFHYCIRSWTSGLKLPWTLPIHGPRP
jgi:hypothetical protein